MPKAGDYFEIALKPSHINWGEYRNTDSREHRKDEGYIPIPRNKAVEYRVLNSNATNQQDVYGKNLFNFRSKDGNFRGILKSQGSSRAGDIYAKQFSCKGDLQVIGKWYKAIDAKVGDTIRITWISHTDCIIEKM